MLYYIDVWKPYLLENQLCEVVETILPDYEVVLTVRIVDECAWYAFLIAESLELYAIEKQAVCSWQGWSFSNLLKAPLQ